MLFIKAIKDIFNQRQCRVSMKVNKAKSSIIVSRLLIILLSLIGMQVVFAAPGIKQLNEDTDFATAKYQLQTIDMEVKVLGGTVRHKRFLDGVIWQFNPNWANLQLEYDADAPEYPSKIRRNRYYYEKSGSQTMPTYAFDSRRTIVKTTTGYRWTDRKKNWIDYDETGYSTSFGDHKGVTAFLIRDADGLLQTVEDRNHFTVMTFNYDANKVLDTVEDYTGRVVDYSFSPTDIHLPKTNFRGAVLYARLDSVVDVRGKTWSYGYAIARANLLNTITDPNGHVRTVSYKETYKAAGQAAQPYVCVDWAGGDWSQGANGSWSFGGYKCLNKVQQVSAGGSQANPDSSNVDEQYQFGARSLKEISDEIGTLSRYTYRYNSKKEEYTTAITRGDNSLEVLTYNLKGELVSRISNGRLVETQIKTGNVREVYDENGNKTVTQEDQFRNPLKITYADNTFKTYRWDIQTSDLLETTDENGHVTKMGYSNGLLTSIQRGYGTAQQQNYSFTYNTDNELETITEPAVNGVSAVTTLEYDGYGNIIKVTDAEHHISELKNHDALGNPRTKIDARGNTWLYTYDNAGNLLTAKTPLGFVTTYSYDDAGNLTSIQNAELKTTILGYDARNRVESVTDALNKVTKLAYNGRNRITGITDELNHSQWMEYNLDGQIEKVIDGNGNEIITDYGYLNLKKFKGLVNSITYPTYQESYSYDTRNRPTQITEQASDAESRNTSFSYYNNGDIKSITHPDQLASRFTYDALNRLRDFTDAAGKLTQLNYDERDQLTQVTNARQIALRRYGYDQKGQLKSETFADDTGYSFDYDGNGNLIRQVDAKGQVTKFVYDIDNRLTTLRYFTDVTAAQSDANAQKTTSFTYDKNNRMKTWDDGQASGSFNYDDVGRLLDWSVDYGSFIKSSSYTYYPNGLKKTFTGPGGLTVSYGYDNNNQLQTQTIPGQGTISVNNFKWYEPETVTLPGGGKVQKNHDGYMRTSTIVNTDSADNALLDYRYQYDNKDNITSINILAGQTTGETQYGYDAMDRLDHYVGPTTGGAIDLGYDAVGNRITDSRSTVNWQYDDRDRLISRDELTYGYDGNGSLTSITHATDGLQKSFIYNLENRLSEIRDGAGNLVASYRYDPFGRRIAKTVNSQITYFFYAPEGLIAEADNAGSITTRYGYRPDNTGLSDIQNEVIFTQPAAEQLTQAKIDENSRWGTDPVFIFQGGQYGYYLTDHLGTPRQIITMSGAILWSADYDAFGLAIISKQSVISNLRYPGQYYDGETGLHYNFFRYYDPAFGRYISSDPIGLEGGINLYLYAYGNVLVYSDPTGEFIPALVGAAIGMGLEALTNPCATAGDILLAGLIGAVGGGISGKYFLRFGSKSLTRKTGKEWSHSIGRKMVNKYSSGGVRKGLNKRGGLNGSWTSPKRHYKHDPSRFPKGWRDFGDRLPSPIRAIDRIPDWAKGSAASGGVGAGVAGSSGGTASGSSSACSAGNNDC
jgi:RHS repeat-associated protein